MHLTLRWELERMFMEDQRSLRDMRVRKKHVLRLKRIIAEVGWPTVSLVGVKAAQGAWIIAQHADFDVEFQRECLDHLTMALPDVDFGHVAYLTDRVLRNEGKPQIYGTQYYTDDCGEYGPWPIRDEVSVNARRFEMGLESMQDYDRRMRSSKPACHDPAKE